MEDKIKIDMKSKGTSTYKIGDASVKIKSWINSDEVAYIVNDVLYNFKETIQQEEDAVALVGALLRMDLLIVALATNLDINELTADEVGATGLFNAIHEKVLNYGLIKDAVISGMNIAGDGIIVDKIGDMATVEELEKTTEQIKEQFEANPEKANELVKIMLANNPALAKELNRNLEEDEN